MKYSRKMVWVSEDDQNMNNEIKTTESSSIENTKSNKKRIERDIDKFHKLLNIVLRIAKNDGYNEDYSINDEHGDSITGSNIVSHLNNALSPGKILIGEEAFIKLLINSNIDPKWIVNENIKDKLLKYRFKPSNKSLKTQVPIMTDNTMEEEPSDLPEHTSSAKRKREHPSDHETEENDSDQQTNKKRRKIMPKLKAHWEIPPPSSDGDDEL